MTLDFRRATHIIHQPIPIQLQEPTIAFSSIWNPPRTEFVSAGRFDLEENETKDKPQSGRGIHRLLQINTHKHFYSLSGLNHVDGPNVQLFKMIEIETFTMTTAIFIFTLRIFRIVFLIL